uniref:ShKT domain-containing protein n=1 Tax=Acrobeloides nanus TaxID=290746 RepID=A0A914CGT3_9BILA
MLPLLLIFVTILPSVFSATCFGPCSLGCASGQTCVGSTATGQCCTIPTACYDGNVNCPTWVKSGTYCTNTFYGVDAILNCRKSCNLCSTSSSGSTSCTDSSSNCANWVRSGFCVLKFYSSIRTQCQASCGLCGK